MAAVKPKVKKRVGPPIQTESRDLLNEGDVVEYGATVEIKHGRKGSFWPKVTVMTTVRPGETGEDAFGRAASFVHQALDVQVSEFLA